MAVQATGKAGFATAGHRQDLVDVDQVVAEGVNVGAGPAGTSETVMIMCVDGVTGPQQRSDKMAVASSMFTQSV